MGTCDLFIESFHLFIAWSFQYSRFRLNATQFILRDSMDSVCEHPFKWKWFGRLFIQTIHKSFDLLFLTFVALTSVSLCRRLLLNEIDPVCIQKVFIQKNISIQTLWQLKWWWNPPKYFLLNARWISFNFICATILFAASIYHKTELILYGHVWARERECAPGTCQWWAHTNAIQTHKTDIITRSMCVCARLYFYCMLTVDYRSLLLLLLLHHRIKYNAVQPDDD